jgi:hypothetical protein
MGSIGADFLVCLASDPFSEIGMLDQRGQDVQHFTFVPDGMV